MAERTAREQFDQQAEHYNAQWNQWSERSLRWLVEHAECGPQDRVLDVATGTGFTAMAFAPLVGDVIGIDVSGGMLNRARAQAADAGLTNVTFQEAAAENLPFPDGSFDRVTCRVAPHHFASVPDFANEAFRVLKPRGRLLIADTTVPDGSPEVGRWQNRIEKLRDPSHVRNYSPSEWTTIVTTAGFEVAGIEILEEAQPMPLKPWLEKGGCTGDAAQTVTELFRTAPADAIRYFHIAEDGGEVRFQWLRVVVSALKRL